MRDPFEKPSFHLCFMHSSFVEGMDPSFDPTLPCSMHAPIQRRAAPRFSSTLLPSTRKPKIKIDAKYIQSNQKTPSTLPPPIEVFGTPKAVIREHPIYIHADSSITNYHGTEHNDDFYLLTFEHIDSIDGVSGKNRICLKQQSEKYILETVDLCYEYQLILKNKQTGGLKYIKLKNIQDIKIMRDDEDALDIDMPTLRLIGGSENNSFEINYYHSNLSIQDTKGTNTISVVSAEELTSAYIGEDNSQANNIYHILKNNRLQEAKIIIVHKKEAKFVLDHNFSDIIDIRLKHKRVWEKESVHATETIEITLKNEKKNSTLTLSPFLKEEQFSWLERKKPIWHHFSIKTADNIILIFDSNAFNERPNSSLFHNFSSNLNQDKISFFVKSDKAIELPNIPGAKFTLLDQPPNLPVAETTIIQHMIPVIMEEDIIAAPIQQPSPHTPSLSISASN